MMDYIEYSFNVNPCKDEYVEILMALLTEVGFDGFIETNTGFIAYVKNDFNSIQKVEKVISKIYFNVDVHYTYKHVDIQNWNTIWESNYEPIFIKNKVAIIAPFHQVSSNYPYTLLIEPKMSFGTGHHPTTMLMIENMLNYKFDNCSVLDMGCGTGILSIFACQKGASQITAIDIDDWAVENTIENCQRNKTFKIKVLKGDVAMIPARNYDFILANINKNVLINDIVIYVKHLNLNGMLFLSGFYADDLSNIDEVCTKNGLKKIECSEKDNWVAPVYSFK